MTYSEGILYLRKKMLLTQAELAETLGVSFATVNRWENGEHEPTMKMKRKLAPLFRKNGIRGGIDL